MILAQMLMDHSTLIQITPQVQDQQVPVKYLHVHMFEFAVKYEENYPHVSYCHCTHMKLSVLFLCLSYLLKIPDTK